MDPVKPIPIVYTPETLSQALGLLKSNPGATLISGGTSIPRNLDETLSINRVAISLHLVKETRRVHASERGLELGATATFGELVELKGARVPEIFKAVLERFSSEPYKNLATLGGNLILRPHPGDLFLPLFLLGAGIEIKNAQSTRWVSAERVWEEGHLILKNDEIVTRVRIPEENWNFFRYKATPSRYQAGPRPPRYGMVASVTRESIGIVRIATQLEGGRILRNRAAEEVLSGQNFPIKERDARFLAESLATQVVKSGLDENCPAVRSVKSFVLQSLHDLSEEMHDTLG